MSRRQAPGQRKAKEVALACARLGLESNCRDAAWAEPATETLVAAMSKTTTPSALYYLSQCLRVVSERLESKEAAGHAGKATDALLATALNPLSGTLPRIVASFSTHDPVAALAHPLCAGPAQRAVLDVLGARCKREIRSPWRFIDWADSNGLDFLAAPKEGDTTRERSARHGPTRSKLRAGRPGCARVSFLPFPPSVVPRR